MLLVACYFIFIQVSLLIPGLVLVKKTGIFKNNSGIELCIAYVASLSFYALLASLTYALKLNSWFPAIITWISLATGMLIFIKNKYYQGIADLRFPLLCSAALSIFSLSVIFLPFHAPRTFLPDPSPMSSSNYAVFDVKVLNVARTQANDNSVPYRQAQFFVNHSDPAKDSFIAEWGVSFFERTPLMGAVTANYFNAFHEKPPIDYIWSKTSSDVHHTYIQFQILAQIANSLLILPGYFLISRLFNRKAAVIASIFIITNAYFIFDSFFSWPKSLVAFFILTSWLLLLEKRLNYTLVAGFVSGVAYLTHDLAVLYFAASLVLLIIYRRFREVPIFLIPIIIMALPWLIASDFIYHAPTTFTEYPFSTNGIPGPGQSKQLIHAFLHMSPFRLIKIRLDNLIYLLTPYQLFTSEGGHIIGERIWSLELFTIPGALGFGLIIPVYLAALRNLKNYLLWLLIITPVLSESLVIGWPKGLGALHFAEAIVVILTGLCSAYLLGKKKLWLMLAYAINVAQTIYFVVYAYQFKVSGWFKSPKALILLTIMLTIIILSFRLLQSILNAKKTRLITLAYPVV